MIKPQHGTGENSIMSITYNWRTSAATQGGMEVSRMHRAAAQNDLGFKVEKAISAINVLQSAVSQINIALGSAAVSMAGASLFSAWSAYTALTSPGATSVFAAMSNFRASNPA